MARWERLKDEEDVDRLLAYAEKAITLNPSNDSAQYFLGIALCISYDHHHTLALLDRAILAMQSAVSYSTPDVRMEALTQLATAHCRRLLHVMDPSDASTCIKYIDQAMECGKISFSCHMMLINCLRDERALSICETLLADDSLSSYERCMARLELGSTLLAQWRNCTYSELLRDPGQLEKCIQTVERVIECTSPEHTQCHRYGPYVVLSHALSLQLRIGNATVSQFEYAISIGRKAVEVASTEGDDDLQARCLETLGSILFTYGQEFPSRKTDEQCLSVFHQASQLSSPTSNTRLSSAALEAEQCFLMQDWGGCFKAYTIAMEAVHHQTWLGLSVVQQHRVISRSIQMNELGRQAARAAVHLGSRETALEWIEQCRSIVWRRVLNLRVSMDAVANVEPPLAHRLREVSDKLQRGAYFDLLGTEEGTLEMRKQQRYRLAEEWEDLVAQTRLLPGFADFLKPKNGAYFASREFGGMVVLLNVYDTSSDAFVLGSNGTEKVAVCALSQMNERLAATLQRRLRKTLQQSGRPSRNARASEPWYGRDRKDGMSFVLSVLWRTVVKPLFDFLHLEPHDSSSESDPLRLWWCPTGPLSFLPLHAAGLYDTTENGAKVYEFVASSYTPTVGILADISNQPLEEFDGLLTVCQPQTPGQNAIPKTADEVYSVIQVAVESGLAMDITSLDNDDATPEAVLSGMAEHSWIHLACHAHQDPTQPLESAFMLAGDPEKGRPLKLTEIAERANTNADFAFSSACQTAMGDFSLSDEAVHLATGMLMAGYRRVIATMWAVNDSDAPIIAEMVYRHMLSNGKADSGKSCLALHHATASLRQKVGEKNFMSWVPFIHFGA
ncbi:CHAT domain-containing protein [Armillaria novae-zelandiae]|uniref:CHAT domain-containing protein n=1 Tax=Armillaria novae-zelandiae TaxID=153914 RepID=A0AA39PB05_9AGAR|nr:CHAT domain-containing protein [Armillaria novae-zelandiae]